MLALEFQRHFHENTQLKKFAEYYPYYLAFSQMTDK